MTFKHLLITFIKRYPLRIILNIVLGFSGAIFNGVSTTLIVPILLDLLGQSVPLQGAPPIIQTLLSPFEGVPDAYRPFVMIGAILLAIILKNASTYAAALVSGALSRSLVSGLREDGIRLLLDVDLDFYSRMKVGDLVNRLGAEVGRTANAINTSIKLVTISITVLVFIGLLISISWQLTLASTVLLVLVTLANQFIIARSKVFGKQLSQISSEYSVGVLETLNGIRLVKATGNEDRTYQKLSHLIRRREKADFQSQMNDSAIAPFSEITSIIALITIVILGRFLFADELEALSAVLLTYLLILSRLLPVLAQLNGARNQLANTSASVDLVKDFLQRTNKPFMRNGTVPYIQIKQGIRFDHLAFAYPSNPDQPILRDINLYLPKGQTLALVGASGAGKSTLADLLPRFYDPASGKIEIDGVDLRDFDLSTLRPAMGIVSQDTFLFNDSVRNNIAYARPKATEEELIEAAKRANAYEFIVRLPQGFDTLIGDRGVMLSGGQRQRLAIARALLQNPEILILDEATSALDTVSERLVQAAIDELSRDRTTLVIAHRLSTVQKADQIAVMDKGYVVEVGTHEELLQKGGYYTRLYSMQFSEEPQTTSNNFHYQALTKTSYAVRSHLNTTVGSLKLIVDGIVDSPEERNELTAEAYVSVLHLLKTLESLEGNNQVSLK